MRLVVFGQVRLLAETFATQRAGEGLLTGVCTYVHVHRVLVLEALRADGAIVQRALLALTITVCGAVAAVARIAAAAGWAIRAICCAAATSWSHAAAGARTAVVICYIWIVVVIIVVLRTRCGALVFLCHFGIAAAAGTATAGYRARLTTRYVLLLCMQNARLLLHNSLLSGHMERWHSRLWQWRWLLLLRHTRGRCCR